MPKLLTRPAPSVLSVAIVALVPWLPVAQWQRPDVPDPSTTPIWHVAGEARGSPAVEDETAFFLSRQHEVLALEARSGHVRWRQRTGESGDTTFGSALAVSGDVVVAGDYDLIAFDRRTGATRWRFEPSEGYGPGIYLGASTSDTVFTGSPAGRVYAVDTSQGMLRWSAAISRDGRTTVYSPATDGVVVAAAYTVFSAPNTGGVALLEATTGKERWKVAFPPPDDRSLSTNWAGGPVLVDDLVIAASGDGLIYAFDQRNGAVRWTIPRLGGDIRGIITTTNREFRALARSGRVLIAGSVTGYIVGYDLDTRHERWRYAGGYNGSAAFSVSADTRAAFIPYVSGFLVALDLASGREIWRAGDWRDGFLYPPAAYDDRLFVGAARAGYFALDARTGEAR